MNKRNILLVGMPGTGKSTLGRLIAAALGKTFVDTDEMISDLIGLSTQEGLDTLGNEVYGQKEHQVLMSIVDNDRVIATGGSAIYQQGAINYLKENAVVIHLSASYATLNKRINNFSSRAIVMAEGMTFRDLYEERMPLYIAAADVHIPTDEDDGSPEQSVAKVLEQLKLLAERV